MATKECTFCHEHKDIETEFHSYKSGPRKGKVWSQCKSCRTEQLYAWRKKNPEKYKANYRKGRLKYKYNLSPEQVKTFGECPICLKEKKLVVDHCHSEGHVRGFLCHNCNTLLGHIENKEKMGRVDEYLKGGPYTPTD